MMRLTLSIFIGLSFFYSCAQQPASLSFEAVEQINTTQKFVLTDYLSNNESLDKEVARIFASMDDTAIVAQLIMPAVGRLGESRDSIDKFIRLRLIGGVLMLNGTKDEFTSWIESFEKSNQLIGNLPFLYSADAEPSLVNRKILGSTVVKKANELTTIEEVIDVATIISKDLNDIGINYNFSPVVDMSPNKTVGYRSFGAIPENIIPWSNAFIATTQEKNIIATAKHFPGHGLVTGDTHKSLQTIDGEMKEVKNYPALIEKGVLSIMVAHIGVQNNAKFDTQGLPSTCSEKIVTTLLRDSLGFKGLIITDAMNMGGVVSVPQAASKAVRAGCDIVLMPVNVKKTHSELLDLYKTDPSFRKQVNASARRIIRMKLAAGLMNKED
jgi:beta-N-acetylhexosaminidase